ncbi:hypothetical protein ACA910_013617 [Epithemia clementina (nom. ined.)]
MSFSGMHTNALLKRQNDANGFGWIFGLSMAATVSIIMKWWWDQVLNRKFTGQRSYNRSLKDRQRDNVDNLATEEQRKAPSHVIAKDPYEDISFAEAAAKIRESNVDVSTADQLMLYGLYKQATQGDAPVFFFSLSFSEQSKHHAWSQFREMPREIASAQYIKHAVALLKTGGSTSKSQSIGAGVSSRPAEPEEMEEKDMTPEQRFLWAAGGNNVDTLRVLLEGGVNVDQRDEGGQTALHMAADAGALEAVELLLKHGANVLASDQYGISVLQAAVIAGNVPVCRILLEHGADPDQPDEDGDTPRHCAEDDGNHDMKELFESRGSVKDTPSADDDEITEEDDNEEDGEGKGN